MQQLPLLNLVLEKYPDVDLQDTLIIACQHILGTTVNLFQAFIDKGVNPKKIYLMGKCYSTNERAYKKLSQLGVNVSKLSMAYKSGISFDEQFEEYINEFLHFVLKNETSEGFKKVIILDDGGQLLLFANDLIEYKTNVVGIEQTSSGFEKLKNSKFNFPIINVAKSEAKLKVEAPLIANLIVEKVKTHIKSNDKILVVGQGAIGKNIYTILKKEFSVVKYDAVTHNEPFPGKYEKNLPMYNVIFGATGQSILTPGNFNQLNEHCVLISASSSDREFSAVYLRRKLGVSKDCHKTLQYEGVKILNSGFPVNFDGKEHSLLPAQAQLTRALLLAAVLQSAVEKGKGLKELDKKIQEEVSKLFKRLQKSV